MPRQTLNALELESRLAPSNTPPALVRDINVWQDPTGSSPRLFTDVNGILFFTAHTGEAGLEL